MGRVNDELNALALDEIDHVGAAFFHLVNALDLQPGVWTKYKIVVEGRNARLYVHGAEQPCLIVNDLKLDPREGGVALWVGPGTEGYFSNLKITPK